MPWVRRRAGCRSGGSVFQGKGSGRERSAATYLGRNDLCYTPGLWARVFAARRDAGSVAAWIPGWWHETQDGGRSIMSDSAKKRLAIDLDEIERQLRQTAPPGAPHQPPSPRGGEAPGTKPDPLAELARIVGQDDPYRAMLSADRAGVAPARRDPDMDAVFAYGRDETMSQNRDPHHGAQQEPQSLPDWRTEWRQQEFGHQDEYGQEGAQDRDTAAGNAGPGAYAPARHPHAAEGDAHPLRPGAPAAGMGAPMAGDMAADEDALFRASPHADANRYAGEDPLQPRPAPPVPPNPAQPAASAPPFAIGGFTRAGDPQARAPYAQDPHQDPHAERAYAQDPYAQAPYTQDPYAQDPYAQDPDAYDGVYDEDFEPDVERSALRRQNRSGRGRKAALTVGAVLAMAVIGVASAIVFVGGSGTAPDGEPPLIAADNAPIRVEPTNPGGMDIPDQDRQIFEGAAEGETRVVDREEQPVDLEEVARQTPRVVLPPPASAQNRAGPDAIAQVIAGDFDAAANAFESIDPSPAIAELGEPRRVSTVVVRPDGSIIRNNGESRTARPAAPAAQSDTASMVAAAPWSVDPSGRPVSSQPASGQPASERTASANETEQPAAREPEATASTDRAQAAPQEQQAAQTPPAPTQPPAPMALTGALQIAPQAQRSNPAPQQTASAPASQSAPAPATGGDYVVQLGISNSEARAEQAFGQFRQRYANIISDSAPIIRRAEVNGSTIYRVRVGPYSLSDANSVCDRIKNSGGDCFVARN